jgi:tetratricopeptide (TPR) repeat protein
MANGEFEQARQMFQGVIAENRYYIDAYDQLALAWQNMGKTEEACAILERAATAVAQFGAAPAQPGQCPRSSWAMSAWPKGLPQVHRDRRVFGAKTPTPTSAWRACAA